MTRRSFDILTVVYELRSPCLRLPFILVTDIGTRHLLQSVQECAQRFEWLMGRHQINNSVN